MGEKFLPHYEEDDRMSDEVDEVYEVSDKIKKSDEEKLALDHFLAAAKKFPPLPREEEHELAKRIAQGDEKALQKLVNSNLLYAAKIAFVYRGVGFEDEDLIQEANAGLVEAARRFDPEKGANFAHYAQYWIRATILEFIFDHARQVKFGSQSSARGKLFYRFRTRLNQLTTVMGNSPEVEAILAEEFEVNPKIVKEAVSFLNSQDISLDTNEAYNVLEGTALVQQVTKSQTFQGQLTGEEDRTVEEEVIEKELSEKVRKKLKTILLSPRQTAILYNRLMSDDPRTLQELGLQFGYSKERIRQIENKLLSILRKELKKFKDI